MKFLIFFLKKYHIEMDMKSLGIQLTSRFENTPKLVKRDDPGNGNADRHQVPWDKNLEKKYSKFEDVRTFFKVP